MRVSSRQSLSLLGCILLVGLSIASCGGSGTTNSTATPPSMTLKVGQITNAIPFFPFYIALQKDFFKAQGLTLDPSPPLQMGSGSKLATAIEAGGVEVAVGAVNDVFTISKVDASIKIVGAVSNAFLLDIVVSKSFEQQMHLSATSP